MDNKNSYTPWLVLLGVILIRGVAGGGVNMCSALFLPPVAQELGVGIGSLSIYFSIISVVMVLWLPVAGKLINRYDIRVMAAAGAALQMLAFTAFGFMNRLVGWYLLAVPYAMGATILIQLLGPILINRWFAKNTGLMMGIQMAFVGLFGAVLQPAVSSLIEQDGWRAAYHLLGAATLFAVLLFTFLFLRSRPQEKGLLPYGSEAAAAESSSAVLIEKNVEISETAALHSASFFLLVLFMIAITGVGVFTQHIPTYGAALGYSMQLTGAALAFSSVGNAVGSIAIGMVSDRIGALKTCYGILGIGAIAVVGFLFSGSGFFLFGMSTFLYGLMSAGIMVLSPILTLVFYGQTDYEKIFSKVSMGAPLASILLVPVYGFVYDWTKSYFYVLLGMLFLLLMAVVCIAAGWRKRCTSDGCPQWRG